MSLTSGPILAFFLAAASLMASDQPAKITDLVHTKWSGGDIPFSAVLDLAQTKDGPLWLATDKGLFSFDGVRFTRFDPLSGTRIRHLLATRDGSLWVVFRNAHVSRLSEGNVTTFPLEELALTNAIAEDGDGSIVAATANGGLARFRDGHWRDAGGALHHSGKMSLEVWFDRDGVLWLATEARLLKLPRGANYFSDSGVPARLTTARQHVFAQSPDGTVWFADRLSTRPVSPSLARSEVNVTSHAVVVDRKGSLWVASDGEGVQRVPVRASIVNKRTAVLDAKSERLTIKDGLSGSRVFCLLEDREGGVWVGTDAGLTVSARVFSPGYASWSRIGSRVCRSYVTEACSYGWPANPICNASSLMEKSKPFSFPFQRSVLVRTPTARFGWARRRASADGRGTEFHTLLSLAKARL
jgi:ligand-binding sensor domain-containing protein